MKLGVSKHFPPPQFLNPEHVGISFSDNSVKAMFFDKRLPDPELKSAILPLEPGAIVAGSIAKIEPVVQALSKIREDFKNPFVFFTIPDELAYVFSVSVAIAGGGNATDNVASVIEENVPLPLNETVFDFEPVSVMPDGGEYRAEFVVAASVKKELDKYTEALRRAELEPLGCLHESQAIASSILPQGFSGISCIVHSRENRVGIYLVKGRKVHFSTLRTILGEGYKREFLDEYQKVLDYYLKDGQSESKPIKYIFVCGDFDYAKISVEALLESGEKDKEIKLSNVWSNVFEIEKHIPEIPYEKSLSFAGPIGAVLSEVI